MNNQILVFNSLVHLNHNQVLLRVKLKNLLSSLMDTFDCELPTCEECEQFDCICLEEPEEMPEEPEDTIICYEPPDEIEEEPEEMPEEILEEEYDD